MFLFSYHKWNLSNSTICWPTPSSWTHFRCWNRLSFLPFCHPKWSWVCSSCRWYRLSLTHISTQFNNTQICWNNINSSWRVGSASECKITASCSFSSTASKASARTSTMTWSRAAFSNSKTICSSSRSLARSLSPIPRQNTLRASEINCSHKKDQRRKLLVAAIRHIRCRNLTRNTARLVI